MIVAMMIPRYFFLSSVLLAIIVDSSFFPQIRLCSSEGQKDNTRTAPHNWNWFQRWFHKIVVKHELASLLDYVPENGVLSFPRCWEHTFWKLTVKEKLWSPSIRFSARCSTLQALIWRLVTCTIMDSRPLQVQVPPSHRRRRHIKTPEVNHRSRNKVNHQRQNKVNHLSRKVAHQKKPLRQSR